jgi:alcohol dehydrogenase (cytochrome c)
MRRARFALLLALAAALPAQVSYERLVNARREPQNWLTYWGDYTAIRHRDLSQVHTGNVKDLRMDWMFQTGVPGAFQTVPLVVNGIMYFTAAGGQAFALDARTGRQLWHYKHAFPPGRRAGSVNRGFAILGDRLFMVTPDCNVVALETLTGRLAWQTEIVPYKKGTYYATVAPLAVKDKIIVGISGGEEGTRGFIDAYNAATGERAWRFWTVPAKGEPGGETWLGDSWMRGGGPAWLTGSFDPALNTLYWGIGNPGPDLYGGDRLGDNLYTDSLVALDPDSGKLKWHFQFTPHDTHDWDACQTLMLLDLNWQGRPRKLVVQANRNAFFYVLDRETGEFLMGKPFARQTWAKGLDAKGRPIVLPNTEPSPEGTRLCPGLAGATNWMAPSYNPQTGLFYLPVREQCDIYYSSPPKYIEGKPYWGSVFRGVTDEKEWGLLKALDPLTGETRWDFRYHRAPWAGTLSTAGGLVFAGDEDGYLMAFDARSGKDLWKFYTGNRLVSSPITYEVNGRQYITMPSGAALLTFALPEGAQARQ